jgi:hypothetical protein
LIPFFTLISLQLSSASTPIKPGGVCKVLKQTKTYQDRKFTCIKSGKKLAWNKGALIPTSVPTPKVELFIPWSTKFFTQDMVQTALNSTSKYFGIVQPNSTYEKNIDPKLSESDRLWITKMLGYANGSFVNIPGEKLNVFVGTSHEWSASTLRSANLWLGDPGGPYPCSDGSRDAYCAEKKLVLLIFSDIYAPNSQYRWDSGRRSTPAHEVFHAIQYALTGPQFSTLGGGSKDMSTKRIPRWFMEGSANYFGYYTVEKLGFDSYQNGRNNQVRLNPEYQTKNPLSTYDNFESNPYGIGQAATEYIIASVGFESLLNIFKFTGSEGSFEAGFKKATGLELSEFYTKFEDARSSMQIGS